MRRSGVIHARIWAILAAVALVLGLAACGGSGSSGGGGDASADATTGASAGNAASGGAQKTVSLTVGIPVPVPSEVPLYVAADNGLFSKQGLNVKIVAFQGGSDLVKAVAGGSVDIAVSALAGALQAVQQGAPIKVVYGGFNQADFNWYAKDFDWSKAKGTRWAVSKIGSSTDFLTRYLLEQHGLNARTDVRIVPTGGNTAILNALRGGQVDAGILAPAVGIQAVKDGYGVVAKQSDLMKEYPFHTVFSTSDFVDGHHDVMQRFLRALVAGMEMAKNDPQAAQAAIVKHCKLPADVAKAVYAANTDQLYPDGRLPDAESMATFWKIGIENGQFPQEIPESKWLDTEWIDSYPSWTK